MADWLGELRGDDDPPFPGQQDDVQPPWGTGFGADQAPAASTVVPLRGRQARQQRKAEEKARKAQAQAEIKAVKAAGRDRSAGREGAGRMPALDPVPPAFESDGRYHQVDDDLDEAGRGRWVSVLVFWAPALILLLLAGVVIWLVR